MGWEFLPPAALGDGGERGVKPSSLLPCPPGIYTFNVEHLLDSRHCSGQWGSFCEDDKSSELTASRESELQELSQSAGYSPSALHPAPPAPPCPFGRPDGLHQWAVVLGLGQPMEGASRRLEDGRESSSGIYSPAPFLPGLRLAMAASLHPRPCLH